MIAAPARAFVGRQPIYDPDLEVAAYELLFREGDVPTANVVDPDRATASVILNTFAEIGLDNIVGRQPAFLNVTENFLLNGHAFALPKERVVLEVLEHVNPTPEIVAAISELSEHGYRIALDDFVYDDRLIPLIQLADIIKVELPAISTNQLGEHVDLLRRKDVQLLAEKVETYEELERCRELQFDLFQGYFFARPKVISQEQTASNRINAVRLLARMQNPDIATSELVSMLSTEPTLCYRILKCVNSSTQGIVREIQSICDAIKLIGLRRLRSLVSLTLLAEAGMGKPDELVVTSLLRGRMCELLAERLNRSQPDSYFMAGLFSTLDAILDKPMTDAVQALNLAPTLTQALVDGTGPISDILKAVMQYDRSEWEKPEIQRFEARHLRSDYLEAIQWTFASTRHAVD